MSNQDSEESLEKSRMSSDRPTLGCRTTVPGKTRPTLKMSGRRGTCGYEVVGEVRTREGKGRYRTVDDEGV